MSVCINSNSTAACLTELAALGAQDTLLTCDPKCSLFHQSYCRITNFAMGEQTLQFQGAPSGQNWSAATSLRAEAQRAGDLLGPVYLDFCVSGILEAVTLANAPSLLASNIFMPAIGYGIIEESKVVIGSQEFESCTGEYFMMHDEISRAEGHRASKLIGDYGRYLRAAACTAASDVPQLTDEETLQAALEFTSRSQKILAPLPHFWTKHPGNYLNVVGSQYHNIVLELKTRAYSQLARLISTNETSGAITRADATTPPPGQGVLSGMSLLAVYVQLDTAERRLKAQAAQTVRFVYTQHASYSTVSTDLGATKQVSNYFNHPVARLVWAWRSQEAVAENEWFRFGAYAGRKVLRSVGLYQKQEVVPEISSFELAINNNSRVHQAAEYFLYAQPYASAKRVPSRIVYSYSFALYPESEDIHSGSLNLSRIDNVVAMFTFKPQTAGATAAAADSIASLVSSVSAPTSAITIAGGAVLFNAETINFYKQAAGMFGLLFAN